MSFDGVFLHHLIDEIKNDLINYRINKIHCIDKTSFVFSISNKKQLLISLNADSSHIRFSEYDFIPATITFPLLTLLKKYFESSIITNIYQNENDRIIIFEVNSFNDLGFIQKVKLVIELFGRNSNLIICEDDYSIIDCFKKTFVLSDSDKRILVPKVKYQFPEIDRINPYKTDKLLEENNYLGVSNLLYSEICFQNNLNIIYNETKPQIIKVKNKFLFYCFDLLHLNGEATYFDNLSKMLEDFYIHTKNQNILSAEQKQIENYLKREIAKTKHKKEKQEKERKEAEKNLNLETIGNLLSSNLYKVKKNQSSITVNDFYNNNEEVTIALNPLLSPSRNLENIFNKFKKAKRAINHLDEQISTTIDEIKYLETLEEQLSLSKTNDLKEIIEELKLSKQKSKPKKKQKPQITTYKDKSGNVIMVGKNNVQNNYLTHSLANKNDYFFHVKDAPGSHTILRCDNLTDEAVILAATIAAFYSKYKSSSNVPVDYTLVKNVKKVPKTKGSFVTYTNNKTVYVTPNLDFIKDQTI